MATAYRAVVAAWLLASAFAPAASAAPLRSADSRRALVATGLSERYFDAHFKLVRVVDKAGDRRVVWKYTVNGYETTVVDSVGFYSEGGRRVDVHSFANTLGKTRDIARTIARAEARKKLGECLGSHGSEAVVFTRLAPSQEAGLYLTSQSPPPPPGKKPGAKAEANVSREVKPAAQAQSTPPGSPPPRKRVEEGPRPKRPPTYVGYVNLETGECTKVRTQVGSS